jgi:anti-sigma B factor antagonist
MEIHRYSQDRVEVIELPSRVMMADAPSLRAFIRDLVAEGRDRLVLDLGGVDFMDSSGLSVLISALKAVQAHGGRLLLLNPQPRVRALIELTRLQSVFEIYLDRDAAVASLS